MRYDEELCKDALDKLFRKNGLSTKWSDGPDPPDYYVILDGEKLAVEITSIHGQNKLDGKEFPWIQLSKELLDFGEKICRQVDSEVNIQGSYILSLPPISNLNDYKKKVLNLTLEYFDSGPESLKPISRKVISRIDNKEIVIWKIKDSGNVIVPQSLPSGAMVSRPIYQLSKLISSSIESKVEKLREFDKPILAILDRYGFERDIEKWKNCIPKSSADVFKSIIRVQNNTAKIITGNILNS